MESLLDDFKKVQDTLGKFNDICTQIIHLEAYIADNSIDSDQSLRLLHDKLVKKKMKRKEKALKKITRFTEKKFRKHVLHVIAD